MRASRFEQWLDALLEARGASLRAVAEAAGVSPSALSAIKRGKVDRPSMETCYRLARHAGASPALVLGLAGYDVGDERQVDIEDPELDLMFHQLLDLTPDERECVKDFVRYALLRASARANAHRGEE